MDRKYSRTKPPIFRFESFFLSPTLPFLTSSQLVRLLTQVPIPQLARGGSPSSIHASFSFGGSRASVHVGFSSGWPAPLAIGGRLLLVGRHKCCSSSRFLFDWAGCLASRDELPTPEGRPPISLVPTASVQVPPSLSLNIVYKQLNP